MLRSHGIALGALATLAVLGDPLAGQSTAAGQSTTAARGNAFAAALPADTLMYMSFPNLAASIDEMQSMPLAKMWHEEEVQSFFERAMGMAKQYWEEGLTQAREMHEAGMLPFDPDELVKARLHSLSLGITSLEMSFLEGLGEPVPKVGILAHADFGDSAPIWRNVMETGLAMMAMQAGDQLVRTETQVGDVALVTMLPGDETARSLGLGLNIAFVGNGVVFGTVTEEVTGLIGRLTGSGAGLTGSDDFRSLAQNVTFAGAEAEMFMRPGAFLDFAMSALRMAADAEPDVFAQIDIAGIERAMTALGLRSIGSIGAAARYVDGVAVTESFLASPEADRKGLMSMAGGELALDFLRWVPKDAVSFQAAKLDASSIWTSLTGALRAYDDQMAEQMLGQLGAMEEQLGMSIENDLFGAFGDDFVTWSMPVAGIGAPPEMAVIFEVPEPERLLRTLETISQLSEGRFSIKKNRRDTYRVNLDIDMGEMAGGGLGINPLDMLTPTFAFQDGYMVVGFSTGDVLRAFKRIAREDDPSDDIRSNPEFAPYLERLPESGIDSLSFTDWKASFESGYEILASMTMMLPISEDIPFEPELLPESSTLTQHLFGSVSWSHTSADGFRVTSFSPFGPELVGLLAGGVAAGAATFAVLRGDEMPIRIR